VYPCCIICHKTQRFRECVDFELYFLTSNFTEFTSTGAHIFTNTNPSVHLFLLQLSLLAMECIKADFVLEGGSIHVDGEGTALVTQECLLHPNRNPHLSQAEIEERLCFYLGVEKVIWLDKGLTADHDTDGHIDNIACFSNPGQVLLSWCDDPSDPMYAVCRDAYKRLTGREEGEEEASENTPVFDARGRVLEVVKLPVPAPMYYTEEECQGRVYVTHEAAAAAKAGDAMTVAAADKVEEEEKKKEKKEVAGYDFRQPGSRMAGSYVNFYIANGAIIVPSFDQPERDAEAVRVLEGVFNSRGHASNADSEDGSSGGSGSTSGPGSGGGGGTGSKGRVVVSVPGCREILLGGGNIHCITQQQPQPIVYPSAV
jgi:agmatine deiminase